MTSGLALVHNGLDLSGEKRAKFAKRGSGYKFLSLALII
jgi:hypothetical protein